MLKIKKIPILVKIAKTSTVNHFLIPLILRKAMVIKKVQTKNPPFSTNKPKSRRAHKIKAVRIVSKGLFSGNALGKFLTEEAISAKEHTAMISPSRKGTKPGWGLFVFPIPSVIAPWKRREEIISKKIPIPI
jgi:hypothetical protein